MTIFVIAVGVFEATASSRSSICEAALGGVRVTTQAIGRTMIGQIVLGLRKALELPIVPLRTVYKTPDSSIAILGSPFESKEGGKALALNLADFDKEFLRWGLTPPAKTAVVVSGLTGVPEIFPNGPSTTDNLTPLVFFGQRAVIFNRENIHSSDEEKLKLRKLLHERSHQLMFYTFGKESFLAKHLQFQEAIADFLPSYFLDEPPVEEGRWTLEDSRNNETTRGDHTSVLPHLLWTLSHGIPKETAAEFYRQLFYYLEKNHSHSMCNSNFHPLLKRQDYRERLACSVAYLLVAIEKVAVQLGLAEMVEREMKLSRSEVVLELGIEDKIGQLRADLPDAMPHVPQVAVGMERGGLGVILGSVIVHSPEILLSAFLAEKLWNIVGP